MYQLKYAGLTQDAKVFLEENNAQVVLESPISLGIVGEHILLKIFVCQFVNQEDMIGSANPYDFYYKTYVEIVQEIPYKNNPIVFTCLIDTSSGEKQYNWSKEKIEQYILNG